MYTIKPRSCPVCNNEFKTLIYKQEFANIQNVTFLKGYDVVVCNSCGAGFADNIPSQSDFEQYYESMSKYEKIDADNVSFVHLPVYDERFARIKKYLTSNLRILDLGCATGEFLKVLKDYGFTNVKGVDPSIKCVEYMQEVYKIDAERSVISQVNIKEKFDMVIMTGVVEHLIDFNQFVNVVNQIINDDGILYLELPNGSGFSHAYDTPFQQFSTEHINYFSITALENSLRKYGFVLDEYSITDVNDMGGNIITPYINAAFRKKGTASVVINKDLETKQDLIRYVEQSKELHNKVNEIFTNLANSQEPIIIWGVGTHTLRFLAQGDLGKCNIVAFVDSNPHYFGGEYKGVKVLQPRELTGYDNRILISSMGFQDTIEKLIKNTLQLDNELILLY
jgi:2-polyprenyl-3-methyl-5-hydroxy-6-metoxy-1,4-benzoquinol methylase